MIRVNDLKKTYGKGTRLKEEVLHGVSFELPETGFICILGRSGSGKTSLLNAVGGLDVYDSGSVEIGGKKISHSNRAEMEKQRNENFGYVFQNYYLLPDHSAAYNIYLGLHSLDLTEKEKLERVGEALKKVGMLRFAKRLVGELSGGQQQRIAIARAIAKSPKVIFADEPTGNLDEESTINISTLLKKLSRKSLVVMVTHEERLANFFADRIITLDEGTIQSDMTEWERRTLSSADSSTVYAGDYSEQILSTEGLRVRVLSASNTDPANVTLIIENGRLIVKADDSRLIMSSKLSQPPYVEEGKRPALDLNAMNDEASSEEERPKQKSALRSGLGLGMLFSEMRTTASKKKLRGAASALFIIILSLMMLFTASDIAEVMKIKPEDFITSDSHVIDLQFDKGPEYDNRYSWSVTQYIPEYLDHIQVDGAIMDYIPDTNKRLTFSSTELPQYGFLEMSLGKYDLVNVERLDPSTIIYGRMPERSDEIVVDIWVIRKCTDEDGIVQNLIPDNEYMIGKRLDAGRNSYMPTIVGICDSGEPSVYISKAGMLSVGIHGIEAIPYSEFVSITGIALEPLKSGQAAVIAINDGGSYYTKRVGSTLDLANGLQLELRELIEEGVDYKSGITVPLVIPDEDVEPYLMHAIRTVAHFSIWSDDKEAVKRAIAQPLPDSLKGILNVQMQDEYYDAYGSFMAGRIRKMQTRIIIMGAIALLCLVMLYILQRFRVRDRLGMISVYRLLGLPARDSIGVFILENVLLTLKYVVPTVFIVWAAVTVLPYFGVDIIPISIPLWVPFATVGVILVIQIVSAVISVVRLLVIPPAKLASKYDF